MNHAFALTVALCVGDLASRRDGVVDVVQKTSPAVVYIGTVSLIESQQGGRMLLNDWFYGPRERVQAVEGLGSGVVVDPGGTILTNAHVIRGAAEIHVVLADGRKLDAEVLGSDSENDLAVLKVASKSPLPFARLGTSADMMIGEKVIAIGSPFGLKKTVTVGVVSALGRGFKADGRVYNDFIQTDASINPGNSGGPLLNIDGDIVGINTAIYAGGQGIGFAIPADKVKRIVKELTQFGKIRPAWVGLDVRDLTGRLAKQLAWDRTFGCVVGDVEGGSPAEKAGVQRGDIIMSVGGTQVEDADDFGSRLKSYPAKTPMPLKLFRSGTAIELTLTPSEFPAGLVDQFAWSRLGLRFSAAGGGLQVSSVRPSSPAGQVGFRPGDIVLRVNNLPVSTLDAFREALMAARTSKSVLLIVQRDRFRYHITLDI